MLTDRTFSMRLRDTFIVLSLLATAGLSQAFAADEATPPQMTSQVFRLSKVTAADAANWLRKLNLGETVSEIHSANAIIVNCAPSELPRVRTIVKYLDTVTNAGVKVLTPLPAPAGWPPISAVHDRLKDIAIGTFKEPPVVIGPGTVVIDEHAGYLVAVGANDDLQKVVEAFQSLQGQGPAPAASSSAAPAAAASPDASDDKLLDKLMEALSREEKTAEAAAEANAAAAAAPPTAAPATENAGAAAAMGDEKFTEMVRQMVRQETEKLGVSQEQPAVQAEALPVTSSSAASDFDIPAADLEIELQLPERLEVIDLLDLLGKYLKLNYMFDEAVLRGQAVNLRVQGKIKVRDLYAIAENVLRFRGLTMTRSNDLVTIVQMSASQPSQGAFVTGIEGVRPGDAMVTRIFQLKHASTGAVRTLLASLKFANNGQNISEIAETGTLVVTDYSMAMSKIEELLAVVDKPGDDRTFRFVKLKYTMAKNLAPKLKDLAEQLGTISISVSASATTPQPVTPGVPRTPMPRVTPAAAATGGAARSGVYLDYDERTNRLLIVGRVEEIALVEELIADLDVAQQDLRTLKQYTIQHVDTSEVLGTLKELGIVQDTPDTTSRTTTTSAAARARAGLPATAVPGQPEMVTTTSAIVGSGPVVEPPMISVIAATNSLLIYATAEQHAAIGLVIAYVDAERGESNINYVVYPLENQDPEKLKGVLESLITGRTAVADAERKVERSPAATRPGQPAATQPVVSAPPSEVAEQEITIVADASTYSLLVYASKKNQQWISAIIKELDKYRPQVLLDVTLVEISRDDAFQYDMDMITKVGSFSTPQGLERLTAANFGNFTHSPIVEGTSLGGTATGFYGDDHIQAIFTAMQKKSYGRIMSRPQLLVNDNEEGTIKAEDMVYVASQKTTYVSTSGETSVISQPVQEVTFVGYPAGVTLTITPHISKGDNLRLKILLDRTDFKGTPVPINVGGEEYTPPPDTSANKVESTITVPDSATIILGGLEGLNQSKGGTKVPILGDIPLVGGLFRSESNEDTQKKLYIFVKAHILRPGEDGGASAIKKVSRGKIEGFEKLEREMQKYQDWPGLDAQPMQPVKVLEER